MSSINTNASAMTALQSLRMTNKAMEHTQTAISTGLRVASAKDNAAYWSIATTMRSDNKAMSTVKDALGLGSATVDVAYTAVESAIKVTDKIKTKLVAAREPGVDRVKIQSEISELQNQLKSISDSASFSGENWLSVDSSAASYNETKSVVSSFTRNGSSVSVGTIDITLTDFSLFDSNTATGTAGEGIVDAERSFTITATGSVTVTHTGSGTLSGTVTVTATTSDTINVSTMSISALTDSDADLALLEAEIQAVDDVIIALTDGATNLGATGARIDLQSEFIHDLMDAIDRGIGQLVDADMNAESVQLQALQVQQQLGIQALSIANGTSQNILSLFR